MTTPDEHERLALAELRAAEAAATPEERARRLNQAAVHATAAERARRAAERASPG